MKKKDYDDEDKPNSFCLKGLTGKKITKKDVYGN